MATVNPFPKANCTYGAPMGRLSSTMDLRGYPNHKLAVRPQGGGDGYDKGGAYWGLPSNVYAVWVRGVPSSLQYVRAESRENAIIAAKLGPTI